MSEAGLKDRLDYASAEGVKDGGVHVETEGALPEYDPLHPLYGRAVEREDIQLIGASTLQLSAPKGPMSSEFRQFPGPHARQPRDKGRHRR